MVTVRQDLLGNEKKDKWFNNWIYIVMFKNWKLQCSRRCKSRWDGYRILSVQSPIILLCAAGISAPVFSLLPLFSLSRPTNTSACGLDYFTHKLSIACLQYPSSVICSTSIMCFWIVIIATNKHINVRPVHVVESSEISLLHVRM